jgi:hypothetical protein
LRACSPTGAGSQCSLHHLDHSLGNQITIGRKDLFSELFKGFLIDEFHQESWSTPQGHLI